MQINWFTVIAQVMNFLILVWLLKRVLYKPVLKAIADREKIVADELGKASLAMTEATIEKEDFQRKNEALDLARKEALSKIENEVHKEKQRLLEEAKAESEDLKTKLDNETERQQDILKSTIVRKTLQEVFEIANKTLSDLANEKLEAQMVLVFVGRLQRMSVTEKKAIREAFRGSTGPAVVTSAFVLPNLQRSILENEVKANIDESLAISYTVNPDLVSGIELNANGYKLSWNIYNYLDAMGNKVAGSLPHLKI